MAIAVEFAELGEADSTSLDAARILAEAQNRRATNSFTATLIGQTPGGEVKYRYAQIFRKGEHLWRRYDFMSNDRVRQSILFNSKGGWRIRGKQVDRLLFLDRFTPVAELNFMGVTCYPRVTARRDSNSIDVSVIEHNGEGFYRVECKPSFSDKETNWTDDPALYVNGWYRDKSTIVFPSQ